MEEEVERLSERMGLEDTKETVPPKQKQGCVPMNSQRLWQHAQGLKI